MTGATPLAKSTTSVRYFGEKKTTLQPADTNLRLAHWLVVANAPVLKGNQKKNRGLCGGPT